jgi:prophage tail gpP-like protein
MANVGAALDAFFASVFRGAPELITVAVDGMMWTAFERVLVEAAFNHAARSFRLEVAAEPGASATNAIFRVGAEVSIFASGTLLLTGYVDRRQPKISATEAMIHVSGRSKSADLIDSSAVHKTGAFKKKTPVEIGNDVSQGIGARFVADKQLEKVDQYHVTPPETPFRLVEKLARQQGMTLTGTADGDVKVTKAGSERHSGGLFEPGNIKVGEADHNGSNRHSKYIVRGQRPFDTGADNLEIEAIARDAAVGRNRPVIIIQDEDTTKERTKKRAKNRRDRAAGNALKATIEVVGFRDEGGKVWEPGHLVWTQSAFLDIAQDMLIETAHYGQDSGGSITKLSLTDPRSYGGEGGKGNQSGADWKQGDEDAESTAGQE